MAIAETDLARIKRWADGKVPAHVRDKLWIEVDVSGHAVTVLECRPADSFLPAGERSPVARLRYVAVRREWELFWRDSNERFRRYDPTPPARQGATLLDAIDRDEYALFWG